MITRFLIIIGFALVFPVLLPAQENDVKDAGIFRYGKVRITRNEVATRDQQSGGYNRYHFRTFSIDSVPGERFFGNHYRNLKNVVKQDPEASIMLVNATHWERGQRICIGATVIGLGVSLLVPMDQRAFNTSMGINLVAGGGILVCYLCKRHWANKSIRTWNGHLDEGKYVYRPGS